MATATDEQTKKPAVLVIDEYLDIGQTMVSHKIETIPCGDAQVGTALHWDTCNQNLYYVDLYVPTICRYDPIEDTTYKAIIENEKTASFVIPLSNKPNEFAVGTGNHISIVNWDGTSPTCKVSSIIMQVEIDYTENRFNCGKADPLGRLFGGTMRCEKSGNIFDVRRGNLYKLDKRGQQPTILKDNVAVPIGMAWNTDNNKFYFIDSCDYNIKEYDYCKSTGQISNPKVLCEFRANENERPKSLPYGMTIDSNGFLYVAANGGSKIFKINPENGKIEEEIDMPCENITSVAFGGPNLDILYATSSADSNCSLLSAGETFKITKLGVKGLPMNNLNF